MTLLSIKFKIIHWKGKTGHAFLCIVSTFTVWIWFGCLYLDAQACIKMLLGGQRSSRKGTEPMEGLYPSWVIQRQLRASWMASVVYRRQSKCLQEAIWKQTLHWDSAPDWDTLHDKDVSSGGCQAPITINGLKRVTAFTLGTTPTPYHLSSSPASSDSGQDLHWLQARASSSHCRHDLSGLNQEPNSTLKSGGMITNMWTLVSPT